MEWISSNEKIPSDKKPIRILVDGEQHIAYWYDDINSYKVGIVNSCCFCGGISSIIFDKSKIEEFYSPFYVEYWMPL